MSHGGKYLDAQILDASPKSKNEDSWQVVIPALNRCQTGPVFIEVCCKFGQVGLELNLRLEL